MTEYVTVEDERGSSTDRKDSSEFTQEFVGIQTGTVQVGDFSVNPTSEGTTDISVAKADSGDGVLGSVKDSIADGLLLESVDVPTEDTIRVRIYNTTGATTSVGTFDLGYLLVKA